MKAIAIKMRKYQPSINIVNNNNMRKQVLNITLTFLGLLFVCYLYLLGNIVWDIVQRRNLEAEATTLSNNVQNLQLQYFTASNQVDLALAQTMGFQQIKPNFAVVHNDLDSIKVAIND